MKSASVAGAIAVTALAGCGGSSSRSVPNVLGMNLPDAVVSLYKAGLCVHVTHKPMHMQGLHEPVVAESPYPGTRLGHWATVDVTAELPLPPGYNGAPESNSGFDIVWGGTKTPCPTP